ncbi:MAG: amino acid ABC transporter substrate-binding protein [Alphaproteobacteria bacterium]|nr:amino acid ABC transporter substrate-binding protein [Alphaproteobacteria bacterium]
MMGLTAALLAPAVSVAPAALAQGTLAAVKARGHLVCSASTGTPGFSIADSRGVWVGFDSDICRAVATAALGDAGKVKFVPLNSQQRITALQSGEIDVLSRTTTWTQQRDAALGLNFTAVVYYDGQGFLAHKKLGVKSAKELNGAAVCVSTGTTTELNLADYFRSSGMTYKQVVFENPEEVRTAYFSGRCDAYTTDASQLASVRSALANNPDDHVILPEIISKEPLAPAVRHGDDQWFDIVRWTVYALIEAEELGVTSRNVDEMLKSTNPSVQRLLGQTGNHGKHMGLDDKWAYNIVKQVGNYGEIFERNLGKGSKLQLERGLNALWSKGGLMYAIPIR